jgi:hypothetical protein
VLDAFVGRFTEEGGEPGGTAASEPEAPDGESAGGGGFDIAEYGMAAERIGVAARELGAAIASLDRSLPQVQRVLEEAAARGDRSIDHASWRAFQLLAAALAGTTLAVLLVRRITLRWRAGSGRNP